MDYQTSAGLHLEFCRNRLVYFEAQQANLGFNSEVPKTILHLVPHESFGNFFRLNDLKSIQTIATQQFQKHNLKDLSVSDVSFSFEGLQLLQKETQNFTSTPTGPSSITNFFRDGVIEEIAQTSLDNTNFPYNQKQINGALFEASLMYSAINYLTILKTLVIKPKVTAFLTLIDCNGFYLTYNELFNPTFNPNTKRYDGSRSKHHLTRTSLTARVEFPGFPIELGEEDLDFSKIGQILRPLFNFAWQTCGREQSPHFNAKGNWFDVYGIED